ncbi:HAD-IA family hydrolase, partial [Patescibacteria group bacterium]|nr:HAD-IA family hydrolase [Patescibacteria group bacterium]
KYAFFDLGGVVFSFSRGLEAIAQLIDVPLSEVTTYWRSRDDEICKGKLEPQQFWRDLVSHFGQGDKDIDFLNFWIGHFCPIQETHIAMRALQSRGVLLGIITNIYPGIFEVAVRTGLIPKLDYQAVVQSCEIGIVKPDQQIFHHAIGLTDMRPSEVILVDDRAENTRVAKKLGWHSLLFSPTRN